MTMDADGARKLAERVRRSGPSALDVREMRDLRAWLESLSPATRVRELFTSGASIYEPVVDDAWNRLGHEPTPDEYRALAALFREAAADLERQAGPPVPPSCGCHCGGGCGDPYAACMNPCPEHMPF